MTPWSVFGLQPAAPIGRSRLTALPLAPFGAHRPLRPLCPSSPSLAHLSLSTFLSFPLVGCATGAPGLSLFPCLVSGPHGGGQLPSLLAAGGGGVLRSAICRNCRNFPTICRNFAQLDLTLPDRNPPPPCAPPTAGYCEGEGEAAGEGKGSVRACAEVRQCGVAVGAVRAAVPALAQAQLLGMPSSLPGPAALLRAEPAPPEQPQQPPSFVERQQQLLQQLQATADRQVLEEEQPAQRVRCANPLEDPRQPSPHAPFDPGFDCFARAVRMLPNDDLDSVPDEVLRVCAWGGGGGGRGSWLDVLWVGLEAMAHCPPSSAITEATRRHCHSTSRLTTRHDAPVPGWGVNQAFA